MARKQTLGVWIALAGLLGSLPLPARAQSGGAPISPAPAKFATPRETLKTLYFSMLAYDFRPALIDDAVTCLDPERKGNFQQTARLAVQLDEVLREICLSVEEVSDKPGVERPKPAPVSSSGTYATTSSPEDSVIAYSADGFFIEFRRLPDGRWCFSESTVSKIPQMYRLALARHRDFQAAQANLRKEMTDPSATMRQFLIEALTGDYYAAAQTLDLSQIPNDQRSDQAPILAQQLMFVIQRRGWIYFQEIPKNPDGPPYTWHADHEGRIALERVRQPNGKDAWLFSKRTVKNLKGMYEAALNRPVDPRYVELGRVVPPVATAAQGSVRPASVPTHLGSPRALLKGFFRVMSEAESNDSKLVGAVEFLDLDAVAPADRPAVAVNLAAKLDAVLRKLDLDLTTVSDSWNAPRQVLGRENGLHVMLVRQRNGRWCFGRKTVELVPQLFDKLVAQQRADKDRSGHLETARDTMSVFLSTCNHGDDCRAAECLDLGKFHPSARHRCGPVLAFKLKYVIDRIGRVYPEEVPDEPEGPRYIFHNGELGRIVIARKTDGPNKGKWLFTAETVDRIEPMFLAARIRPAEDLLHSPHYTAREPCPEETPGIWLRTRVPHWGHRHLGGLQLYQWLGLPVILLLGWIVAKVALLSFSAILAWVLRQFGSVLTASFVSAKLRPLTWVVTGSLFYRLLVWLDLPITWLDTTLATEAVVLAIPLGWFGFHLVDLLLAVYTNSELLRPHRSLSDMVVPVCFRLLKGGILIVVVAHVVYQLGRGDLLVNFLTGLGACGLAASLAAQDIVKSFFGTLLLVGERSFKLGDRIKVNGYEGVVEQVGFRSMRLRTSDGSLVTIPNSTIASASIDIQGEQVNRRHTATVSLGKDLPVEQIAAVRDHLHDWLRGHPSVKPEQTDVTIGLHRETGAELQVNLQLGDLDGADEATVRREINYAILKVVQELEHGPSKQAPKLRAMA